MAKLTAKQAAFVEEYLIDRNATRAAERAGYTGKTINVIAVTGHRLLKNPNIAEAIRLRTEERAMAADEVLARLAEQARASLGDFVTVDGYGTPRIDLSYAHLTGLMHLIKKIRQTQHGIEIELHDQQRALELLGRNHGLFREQVELTGEGGGPVQTRDVTDLTDEQLAEIAARGNRGK